MSPPRTSSSICSAPTMAASSTRPWPPTRALGIPALCALHGRPRGPRDTDAGRARVPGGFRRHPHQRPLREPNGSPGSSSAPSPSGEEPDPQLGTRSPRAPCRPPAHLEAGTLTTSLQSLALPCALELFQPRAPRPTRWPRYKLRFCRLRTRAIPHPTLRSHHPAPRRLTQPTLPIQSNTPPTAEVISAVQAQDLAHAASLRRRHRRTRPRSTGCAPEPHQGGDASSRRLLRTGLTHPRLMIGLPRFRRHLHYVVRPGLSGPFPFSINTGCTGAEPPCTPCFSSNSTGL